MTEPKTRTQLQKLFKSGAKPSEADFKDLIDGSLNIADDGITKPAGADTPLKISTHGEQENVLDIYAGDTPTWRLNQKPTTDTEGLNIETGGESKLFIESSTGNLGLGITKPIAKLHIQQSRGQNALRIDDEANDTTPLIVDAEGKVGIGTDKPNAKLDVKGDTAIAGNLSVTKISNLTGGLKIDGELEAHINADGAIYRKDGQVYLTVDDNFYIRDSGSLNEDDPLIHIDTRTKNLRVHGDTNIVGNLSIDKNVSTTGELSVTKISTLTGKVGIGTAPGTEQLKIKGDTAIVGSLTAEELLFEDKGQIRSRDDNHRILFRRDEDILELREYGDIVFSSGATAGEQTAKMRLNSAGNLAVSARITDKTGAVMPIGAILSYGGATAPQGWLLCDGRSYKRTDYPDLYKIISNNFGTASRTAFNVPDLRGRFLRGVDNGTGRDPDAKSRDSSAKGSNIGDRVGSVQQDQFRSHNHSYTKFPDGHGDIASGRHWKAQDTRTGSTGGSETRPKNVYVNFIIKF